MNYVGIDWAYGRAAFCAMNESGTIQAEGLVPADEDGLAKLVINLGLHPDVRSHPAMLAEIAICVARRLRQLRAKLARKAWPPPGRGSTRARNSLQERE